MKQIYNTYTQLGANMNKSIHLPTLLRLSTAARLDTKTRHNPTQRNNCRLELSQASTSTSSELGNLCRKSCPMCN